jgi:hypothetical protein
MQLLRCLEPEGYAKTKLESRYAAAAVRRRCYGFGSLALASAQLIRANRNRNTGTSYVAARRPRSGSTLTSTESPSTKNRPVISMAVR